MKFILALLLCYTITCANAQVPPHYVAAKAGLNLREKPDPKSKTIINIPYGTKLEMNNDQESNRRISTEGMSGYWRKVKYKDHEGFIIDSYLLPIQPPSAKVKTMKDYLAEISAPFGDKLTFRSNTLEEDEAGSYELQKQLFRNGAEYHAFQGYEYSSATYFLPGLSLQEGFLLLRLIPEYAEVFSLKDAFPSANKTFKKNGYEYSIRVDKEQITDIPWIKKISVEFESGIIYNFEMYQIDTQLVIFLGGGV